MADLGNQQTNKVKRHKNVLMSKWRLKRAIVLGLVFLFFVVFFMVKISSMNSQLGTTQDQINAKKVELRVTDQRHSELKLGIRRLNNQNYLGQLIRDKYYYTKPDEKVYILPGEVAKDVTQN